MNLQRVWWAVGMLLVIAAALVCLVPSRNLPHSFEWNDKVSHIVGHGALALWFAALGWLGLARWPEFASWLLRRRQAQ
jgi:hypothetical protein